jgi:K+-transporting ATPase ATPase A chain
MNGKSCYFSHGNCSKYGSGRKEVRLVLLSSANWATYTTVTSNGSQMDARQHDANATLWNDDQLFYGGVGVDFELYIFIILVFSSAD